MSEGDVLTTAIGHVFRGVPRELTLARTLAFSGGSFDTPDWPERNLHTDLEAANETGLAKVVASGTQFEGYLATHLIRVCGRSWYTSGSWDVKILRSVKVGDAITAMAKLLSRDAQAEGVRVGLEVWCQNQDGENVLAGTATCVLASAP